MTSIVAVESNQDILLLLKEKPLRFSEIARALNLGNSSLNRRLDKLKEERLITDQIPDPDGKCWPYALTDYGRRAVNEVIPELQSLKAKFGMPIPVLA